MAQKYNFICLSNQLWDYPNWTNKRHVMYRLSKLGHNILFVDPSINFGRLLWRQVLKGFWNFERLISSIKKDGEVTIFTPIKVIPWKRFFTWKFVYQINLLINKFPRSQKTILWVYNVELENLNYYLDNLKYDYLIYDCVDYYAGFPKYDTKEKKEKLLEIERNLATKANLVFGTAPGLVERLSKLNSKTFYTPNVGDFEMFHNIKNKYQNEIPQELKNLPKPIIGYIGALDSYKFDFELLKKSAQAYPDYSFVIIGDIALKDREGSIQELGLQNIPNVYFLGSKPFVQTPKYSAFFDVELIPYVYNDYTIGGCFPVKFFNTLSAGTPCVVTDLPVFSIYKNVSYVSKSHQDFVLNIKRALEENNKSKEEERILVARENTWDLKVSTMLEIVNENLK